MPRLMMHTHIRAPLKLCFDMARDVSVHCQTARHTKERVVGGRSEGLLQLGDSVTFEAVHLGVRQRLTATIVEMDAPHCFVDEMLRGAFKSLRHTHEFKSVADGTRQTDIIEWASPCGVLGIVADTLFLKQHMARFLSRKNRELKRLVEQRAARLLL
jgi:ligand-binding SRPBCC domain-containing protein